MALTLTNGVWVLAPAASGPTLLTLEPTPTGASPSSFADTAVLDGGMLTGWRVHDPGSHFTAVTDDGTDFIFTSNACDEVGNGSAWALAARFFYPTLVMGDVDFSVRIKMAAVGGTSQWAMGVGSGESSASNVAGSVVARAGRGVAVTGYSIGNSNAVAVTGGPSPTLTDYVWIRITIVGETVTWYTGGAAEAPSWSSFATRKMDRAGGVRYFYISPGGTGRAYSMSTLKAIGWTYEALP